MELMVEASPRRIYANAHTYHINSISVNSDAETYLSADDLRINLWHLDITDQSFNIVDIKPANMEELTEVITAAEFHPTDCNNFVYSSSKGLIRLCDMRMAALCDRHAKRNSVLVVFGPHSSQQHERVQLAEGGAVQSCFADTFAARVPHAIYTLVATLTSAIGLRVRPTVLSLWKENFFVFGQKISKLEQCDPLAPHMVLEHLQFAIV